MALGRRPRLAISSWVTYPFPLTRFYNLPPFQTKEQTHTFAWAPPRHRGTPLTDCRCPCCRRHRPSHHLRRASATAATSTAVKSVTAASFIGAIASVAYITADDVPSFRDLAPLCAFSWPRRYMALYHLLRRSAFDVTAIITATSSLSAQQGGTFIRWIGLNNVVRA